MTLYRLSKHGQVVKVDLRDRAAVRAALTEAGARLAYTKIQRVRVTTLFLGIDASEGLAPTPLLWETRVTRGGHDIYKERYSTHETALAGHHRTVERYRARERVYHRLWRAAG